MLLDIDHTPPLLGHHLHWIRHQATDYDESIMQKVFGGQKVIGGPKVIGRHNVTLMFRQLDSRDGYVYPPVA